MSLKSGRLTGSPRIGGNLKWLPTSWSISTSTIMADIEEYRQRVPATMAKYGDRIIVRGASFETLEAPSIRSVSTTTLNFGASRRRILVRPVSNVQCGIAMTAYYGTVSHVSNPMVLVNEARRR